MHILSSIFQLHIPSPSCSLVVCICEHPVCGLVGELLAGRGGQRWRRDDLCCCGGSRSPGTHGPTRSGKESNSEDSGVFQEWTALSVVSTLSGPLYSGPLGTQQTNLMPLNGSEHVSIVC